MLYYVVKILVSAAIVVAVSEIAKRHSGLAALLAALPLTSLLAFVWIYVESGKSDEIAALSTQVFWLVLPSLLLFLLLPLLLRHGLNFWLSLALAAAATSACYLLALPILRKFGVQL